MYVSLYDKTTRRAWKIDWKHETPHVQIIFGRILVVTSVFFAARRSHFLQLEYRKSIGIVSDTFLRKVSKNVSAAIFEQSIGIVTDTFFKVSWWSLQESVHRFQVILAQFCPFRLFLFRIFKYRGHLLHDNSAVDTQHLNLISCWWLFRLLGKLFVHDGKINKFLFTSLDSRKAPLVK